MHVMQLEKCGGFFQIDLNKQNYQLSQIMKRFLKLTVGVTCEICGWVARPMNFQSSSTGYWLSSWSQLTHI